MSIYVAECSLGRGVFASRLFRCGEPILGFGGAVIDRAKCLAKGEREGNALQITPDVWLDTTEPGVFANHSCDPNSYLAEGNLLVALCDIRAREQIMFDYSTTMYVDEWTMECRCGSPKCRGTIREFRLLPQDVQAHYMRIGAVAPFILREMNARKTAATHPQNR